MVEVKGSNKFSAGRNKYVKKIDRNDFNVIKETIFNIQNCVIRKFQDQNSYLKNEVLEIKESVAKNSTVHSSQVENDISFWHFEIGFRDKQTQELSY